MQKQNKEQPRTMDIEPEVAVCDGGSGELGHPLVYLPFGQNDSVTCYYCGQKFNKKRHSR